MRRTIGLIGLFLSSFLVHGQITLIGKNTLNGQLIKYSKLLVYADGAYTQSLSTGNSSDFMLKLPFGKVYSIYFINSSCPLMHLEVVSNTIPADKYAYRMSYELTVPMVDKEDPDVDTTVFSKPFHKVIFDGSSKMIADTNYNSAFSNHILKKQNSGKGSVLPEGRTVYAGKIKSDKNPNMDFTMTPIDLIGPNGNVLKTLYIDRLGYFAFQAEQTTEVSGLRMNRKDSMMEHSKIQLLNDKEEVISGSVFENGTCSWELNKRSLQNLADNSYVTHVGGKIVISSPKEKKFYSDRRVYLLNKRHTVVEKTITNSIGSFVFNDIVPDQLYFIAVDREGLLPSESADLLNKDDHFVSKLDSVYGDKRVCKISSASIKTYNELLVADDELHMDINANIYGDNVNNPIGKLKIVLLNDNYEPIDSVITNDFGSFKFKYLPFLKRFYLDADNSDNILDVFRNILIYSSEEHLIKILTHQKGKKFVYKPLAAEITEMREVELEDPWLRLMDDPVQSSVSIDSVRHQLIVENIHFENNRFELSQQAKEVLDKIILVLNEQKQINIEIGAYTDSNGSELENLKLSQQRAKSVLEYIEAAGIESKRLISKGYGESLPLVICDDKHPCTESDHAKNRRIEFKIINNLSKK